MGVNMTKEELNRLRKQNLGTEDEMLEALGKMRRLNTDTMAGMGASYKLGNLTITPPPLGILPLLEAIRSPFLDPDPERTEFSFADVSNALYVIANGEAAVEPVAGIVKQEAALAEHKDMAEKSPEHYRAYLSVVAEINEPWADFEQAAARFWADNGNLGVQEVADFVVSILNDAMAGFSLMPTAQDKPGPKKKLSSIWNTVRNWGRSSAPVTASPSTT